MIQITITMTEEADQIVHVHSKQAEDNKTELEELVATAIGSILQNELNKE